MKKINAFFLVTALFAASCNSKVNSIFTKKTPHEKYEEVLQDKGLHKTPEGRQWLAASEGALKNPQTIQLPYRHLGTFPADKARALGLQFTAKRGQRLLFNLTKPDGQNFALYAQLYKAGGTVDVLRNSDTTLSEFGYDVSESGTYILKLQPELFRSGLYNLSIAIGPSIGFPVSDGKAYVGSVWGDNRDGGKRLHEGIDIFAKKGSPAVAAADGFIVGVRDGGLGGKTVFLRPDGANYTLYYAHLDEQSVHEGQAVKKGQTIGTVGNTGNAAHTASHLHFGIYTTGGAIDPLPFVEQQVRAAPTLAVKKIDGRIRLIKDYKEGLQLSKNTVLLPIATTGKSYIAEAPDGTLVQVPASAVQVMKEPKTA